MTSSGDSLDDAESITHTHGFCQLSRHLGFFRLAMYTYLSERRG
jgi:hypothetical protein